ncbi:MAG: phosphoesterase [Lachnospiraceae bacterium]|nr:phosphoesterase [Lachnospiraceae bacterium]MDD3614596.1 phosphoesterase [Lachnospiraceae bacterium]
MKQLLHKYRHGIVFIYVPIYMIFFSYLEKHITRFHVIHTTLDKYIPFCEYFIVPYLLWFFFIAGTVAYFFFKASRKEFYQLIGFLFTGMTIFLIVSAIYPNGHFLRPTEFSRDNIFIHMVQGLYSIDTSTNVLPSIHVFNTLGAWTAIKRCESLKNRHGIQTATRILSIAIILSTMFLKQHSIVDVACGMVMALVFYVVVYTPENLVVRRPARSRSLVAEK